MAGFISTRALNNFIKLGAAAIVTGSVVNSTLYNGKLSRRFRANSMIVFTMQLMEEKGQ